MGRKFGKKTPVVTISISSLFFLNVSSTEEASRTAQLSRSCSLPCGHVVYPGINAQLSRSCSLPGGYVIHVPDTQDPKAVVNIMAVSLNQLLLSIHFLRMTAKDACG